MQTGENTTTERNRGREEEGQGSLNWRLQQRMGVGWACEEIAHPSIYGDSVGALGKVGREVVCAAKALSAQTWLSRRTLPTNHPIYRPGPLHAGEERQSPGRSRAWQEEDETARQGRRRVPHRSAAFAAGVGIEFGGPAATTRRNRPQPRPLTKTPDQDQIRRARRYVPCVSVACSHPFGAAVRSGRPGLGAARAPLASRGGLCVQPAAPAVQTPRTARGPARASRALTAPWPVSTLALLALSEASLPRRTCLEQALSYIHPRPQRRRLDRVQPSTAIRAPGT